MDEDGFAKIKGPEYLQNTIYYTIFSDMISNYEFNTAIKKDSKASMNQSDEYGLNEEGSEDYCNKGISPIHINLVLSYRFAYNSFVSTVSFL